MTTAFLAADSIKKLLLAHKALCDNLVDEPTDPCPLGAFRLEQDGSLAAICLSLNLQITNRPIAPTAGNTIPHLQEYLIHRDGTYICRFFMDEQGRISGDTKHGHPISETAHAELQRDLLEYLANSLLTSTEFHASPTPGR